MQNDESVGGALEQLIKAGAALQDDGLLADPGERYVRDDGNFQIEAVGQLGRVVAVETQRVQRDSAADWDQFQHGPAGLILRAFWNSTP